MRHEAIRDIIAIPKRPHPRHYRGACDSAAFVYIHRHQHFRTVESIGIAFYSAPELTNRLLRQPAEH